MKLGLYGWDLQVAAVVRAARRDGSGVAVAAHAPEGEPLLAGVSIADTWEALIDERACDAILVGGDGWDESRADGVRHLVQAGRPLLLAQPLTLSMLLAYEFDMIRADVGGPLLPYLPDRQHPFVLRLRDAVEGGLAGSGVLGRLESMTLVRRIPDRSKQAVLTWLARDADLIRLLIGEPQRLSTLA
ncbi:MAG: hypothetical protein ACO3NZ_12660, partial [Pirellulales bacterium]